VSFGRRELRHGGREGAVHRLQHLLDPCAVARRDAVEFGEVEEVELALEVARDLLALVAVDRVHLVHRHHERAPRFEDVAADVRILFRDVLVRVDHEDHHVGALDRLQRLHDENFSTASHTLPRLRMPAVSINV
jgi:hypothetical protein